MNRVFKPLALLLLLMVTQQGAAVHELSHHPGWSAATVRIDAGTAAETSCALCPAFAQALTPAFSHSFHIPLFGRASPERRSEPRYSAFDAAVPQPRNRGPPSAS